MRALFIAVLTVHGVTITEYARDIWRISPVPIPG
jgi:hypothetical protein